jgi:ribonuclease HI/transposase InsO family protein
MDTIQYKNRSTIKSQALADFLCEWTDLETPLEDNSKERWTMYFDGSVDIDGPGAGVYIISPAGDTLRYVLRLHFKASNNAAEYEAALHGLRIAVQLGIKRMFIYGDSKLVISQVNKDWDCKHEKMDAYVVAIRKLESKFYGLRFEHALRNFNQAADELSKLGLLRAKIPAGVFVEDLWKPSILVPDGIPTEPTADQIVATSLVTNVEDWRVLIIKYLREALVLEDTIEQERIVRRSKNYVLVDDRLMRKNSAERVLQKCITQGEGIKLLDEIHGGICGNHAASRTLVGKGFRAGFYWPTAVADAEELVRHCVNCQFFAKQIHVPAHELQTIPAAWPFSCWGLDAIGPFKPAPGGFKWVFVMIDKFSKWIEYLPLVDANSYKAVDMLDDIIHRFGLPNSIITDLGSTFTGTHFWDFCEDKGIRVKYVSVAHPRANGQAERANGMILEALCKRLFRPDGKFPCRWLKELPAVVWGLRTQPCRSTGVSPYFMVYGSKAVLPADVAFPSPRVEQYDEETSDAAREDEIMLIEERQLASCTRNAKYLEGVRRYYNRNIKDRAFAVGDLVLRRRQKPGHKLESKWDGPFKVNQVTRPGSYRLLTMDNVEIPNSWNIEHLRRFFP